VHQLETENIGLEKHIECMLTKLNVACCVLRCFEAL